MPIVKKEPPITAVTVGSDFKQAWGVTSDFEGGEVNDPDDPGGHTKYGISKRAYPNEDIGALTPERASHLAQRDYWFPLRLDALNCQMVAGNLFDFALHHGVRGVGKKIQIVLAKYFGFHGVVDGIIGSFTIGYINELLSSSQAAPFALHQALVKSRMEYYLQTAKPKYLEGFIRRATYFL